MRQRGFYFKLATILVVTAGLLFLTGCDQSGSLAGNQGGGTPDAADPVPGNDDTPSEDLTLALSVDQQSYLLGRPVAITVELLNDTDAPVETHHYLEPEYDFLSLTIMGSDGAPVPYFGPSWGLIDAPDLDPVTLEPGERFSVTAKVYYNALRTVDHLAFPEAGEYTLQAALRDLRDPAVLIASAPVAVTMRAPTGSDAIVWEILRTPEAAFFVQTGRPPNRSTIASELEQLLERYPDTSYAPAIQAALDQVDTTGMGESEIVVVNVLEAAGRSVIIKSDPEIPVAAQEEAARAILGTVDAWVNAYNENNPDSFFSYFSTDNIKRQKWERDSEHLDHQDMQQRFAETRGERGDLRLRIVRLALGESSASADIEVIFDRANIETYQKLRLVREADGSWRIFEASCALFC